MEETLSSLESDYRLLCSEYERRHSSSATVHRFGALKAFLGHELGVARKAMEDCRFVDFGKSTQVIAGKLEELYGLCYGKRR